MRACVLSIRELPHRHPLVLSEIRRALVNGFPFALFYAVEGDEVVLLAFVHTSRDPRRWPREP